MNPRTKSAVGRREEESVLVLQGGGALGAYQAGVFETLAGAGEMPHWVAGISIGAINAALIAGNPPERRVQRLHEFWDTVTSSPPLLASPVAPGVELRRVLNEANATLGAVFGLPGFFVPRFPAAALQLPGTPGALSFYDTGPLRATLERLVDFDLLNRGSMRLSVGAVNVRTGNFAYFDTADQRLDARHIMASGALPRALAAASCEPTVTVDQVIYRRKPCETQSKDYEFSRLSMHEHWQAGGNDMAHTLGAPAWKARTPPRNGVQVFDLTLHPAHGLQTPGSRTGVRARGPDGAGLSAQGHPRTWMARRASASWCATTSRMW